jgi:hypothetical protein
LKLHTSSTLSIDLGTPELEGQVWYTMVQILRAGSTSLSVPQDLVFTESPRIFRGSSPLLVQSFSLIVFVEPSRESSQLIIRYSTRTHLDKLSE